MKLVEPVWLKQDDAPDFPGGEHRVDVAVVGGGLTGLSTAYHLLKQQPDKSVAVFEANKVGAGATCRSTGMASPGVGQDAAALIRRAGRDRARDMYLETLDSVRYIGQVTEEEGIDCDFLASGMLVTARGKQGPSRLEKQANALESLDLPCERLDRDALGARLNLDGITESPKTGLAALKLPIAATMHPGKLILGLSQIIRERGGKIFQQARVTDIDHGEQTVLRLESGQVTARKVVLATSGYIGNLGLQRGRILPVHLRALVSKPLTDKAFAVLGWAGRECVIDSRRLFSYFRLTPDNRVVLGGGLPAYRWRGNTKPNLSDKQLQDLQAAFREVFPAEAGLEIEGGWTGLIGYVLDTIPLVYPLPRHGNVLYAGGWCGHGLALGFRAGTWLAHMIAEGRPTNNLPWYRGTAPFLPTEPVRWLGFKLGTGVMAAMDRT